MVPRRPEGFRVTLMTCKKVKQILARQALNSTFSKCLNNALIPNHFKPVCLSEDICSVFENENKVSARFNLFLSQISPPTAFAHPTGTACLLNFTPPHRTTLPTICTGRGKEPARTSNQQQLASDSSSSSLDSRLYLS